MARRSRRITSTSSSIFSATASSIIIYLHLFLLFHRTFSSVVAIGASIICSRIPGLAPKQRVICQGHPDAMAAVGEGARLAFMECRQQFRYNRWNCSGSWSSESPLIHLHSIGTREIAYVYAIRSAGIAFSVTQACSLGNLMGCGCDRKKSEGKQTPEGTWKWGGCSADVAFGIKFSRVFSDARELDEDARTLMNIHNHGVGRKALKDSVTTQCKCHGVSASCSLKTCWITLPKFRVVGDRLTKRYLNAKKVEPLRGRRAMNPVGLKLAKSKIQKKPSIRDLVYLHESPNYCNPDPSVGSLGTFGRICNRTSALGDGCDSMCCGRGYNTHQENVTTKCNCKFYWCCKVTCQQCTTTVEQLTCK